MIYLDIIIKFVIIIMIIKERYFMKKLFFGLTLFIIATIGTIYGVLFTKTGNDIIAS
jgi:hypothetical protein